MADVDGVELAPFTVILEQARIVREAIHIDPKHMAVVFGGQFRRPRALVGKFHQARTACCPQSCGTDQCGQDP